MVPGIGERTATAIKDAVERRERQDCHRVNTATGEIEEG